MANLSYNVSSATLEGHEMEPDKVSTGTNAPGAGDIEVRINLANFVNNKQIIRALRLFILRLEDGRLVSNDTGEV